MGFDEWFDNQNYEAGAASRQAEINELQKRIDDAIKVFEEDLSPLIDQIEMVCGILKGDR